MQIIKLAPLAAFPALLSCSAVGGGGAVPAELSALCVGTVSSDGKNSAVAVSLGELIAVPTGNGFTASWDGSATAGVLTLHKDDQFAGKTMEIAFETERRPYAGPVEGCQPNIAVLVRAKVDGRVLNAFASEDAALTFAQQALKTRPTAAPTPPPALAGPNTTQPADQPAVTPVDGDPDPDAYEQEPYEDAPSAAPLPPEDLVLTNAM